MLRAARIRLVFILALICGSVGVAAGQIATPSATVDVYVFWSSTCPHCERALAYLSRLSAEQPALRLHRLEVTDDAAAADLFRRINEKFGVDVPAVPMIIIGETVLIGYDDETTTGESIALHVRTCLAQSCTDIVRPLMSPPRRTDGVKIERPPQARSIKLPLVGEISTAGLSLPLLTIAMAAADGFNPCAMWGLVFLMGLLIGLKDRRRMWILGSAFVAVSAVVYFAIMAAWLNLLLVLGALAWIRIGVALIALAGGAYYLREFVRNDPVCKITAPEGRRRLLDRVKAMAQRRQLGLALLAVGILAVAVNLIDFLCSAGLPAVYTEALTQSRLPIWQYYAYLGLYIVVFMADDLLVFATAMTTLTLSGFSTRYTRYANLVGGVLLAGIGFLLLFRPGWLAFG